MISWAAFVLLVVAISVALLAAGAARALVRHERAQAESAQSVAPDATTPSRHRLVRFIVERFSPGPALGLLLTACVFVCLAALALFGEVADNIVDRNDLSLFDARFAAWLAPHRTPTTLAIANWVSHAGTIPVMWICATILIATLFRREWRAVAVGWVLLAGGGEMVEQILKRTFRRDRPANVEQWLVAGGFSFPSGHTMGAVVGYGLMTYLVLFRVRNPIARAAVIACGTAIIAAIGFSRLVLGVHYVTDVIGGFAAGAVWISLAIAAVEVERSRWRRRTGPATASSPVSHFPDSP
jgi:membrane-associated phospholipid phosphatase